MTLVDIASDVSLSMTKQVRDKYGLPGFVKGATDDDLRHTDSSLAHDVFACPKLRKFANISGPATWLNYAMFREQENNFKEADRLVIKSNFLKHADFWGVRKYLLMVDDKVNIDRREPMTKTASAGDYAFSVTDAAGITHHRCYVGDVPSLLKSAAWLHTHGRDLVFAERQKIAQCILDRADQYEISFDPDMEEHLHKTAGLGVSTRASVAKALTARAVLSEGIAKDALYKFAEDCKNGENDFTDNATALDVVRRLDAFDQMPGWRNKYASGLPLPEEILDVTHRKVAELKNHIVETATGRIYSKDQFAGLNMELLADHVGLEFAKRASIDESIDPDMICAMLKTANHDTAQAFDRFMQQRGVKPVSSPTILVRLEPEAGAWGKLAESYSLSN